MLLSLKANTLTDKAATAYHLQVLRPPWHQHPAADRPCAQADGLPAPSGCRYPLPVAGWPRLDPLRYCRRVRLCLVRHDGPPDVRKRHPGELQGAGDERRAGHTGYRVRAAPNCERLTVWSY